MNDADQRIADLERELEEVRTGYHALDKNWERMHDLSIDMFRAALDMSDASIPDMCARIAHWQRDATTLGCVADLLKSQIGEARRLLIAALGNESALLELPLPELIGMLELDLQTEYERAGPPEAPTESEAVTLALDELGAGVYWINTFHSDPEAVRRDEHGLWLRFGSWAPFDDARFRELGFRVIRRA